MYRPLNGPSGPNRTYGPGNKVPRLPTLPLPMNNGNAVRRAQEAAQRRAAAAAAAAARNKYAAQAGQRRPPKKGNPGTPAAGTETPTTQTTPPGPPGQDGTYSTNPPGQAAYEQNRAIAEQAWRDAQTDVQYKRNSLGTQYGYKWDGSQYSLDAGGQGEYQNTARQYGAQTLDLLDSGAGRGIDLQTQQRQVSAGQQNALAGMAQRFAGAEGGLAGILTREQGTYQRTLADLERERVDAAANAGEFNPARAPADLPETPTSPETPPSGGDTTPQPGLGWFNQQFSSNDWNKFVNEARRRGVNPQKLIAAHPALRRFFGK